ncbi:O-antigen ligase family protein [Microbacterium arborescens]
MQSEEKVRVPLALVFAAAFIVVQDTLTLVGLQGPATVAIFVVLTVEALTTAGRNRTAFSTRGAIWPSVWFVIWAGVLYVLLNPSVVGFQNLVVWALFPLAVGTVYAQAKWGTYARIYPWVRAAAVASSLIYIAQVAATGIGSGEPLYSARGAGWLALLALTIVLPRVVLFKESWWPALLLLGAIVLSLSRTPMAIAAGMIVIAWALRATRGIPPTGARFAGRLILAGGVLGAALVWAVLNVPFITERFTNGDGFSIGGITINSSGRAVLWEMTIQQWLASPWVGHGPGSAQELITERFPNYISHPHNEYLRILDDTGIIGLVLWSMGIVFFAVRALAALRTAKDRESRAIHLSALLGVLLVLVGSATDNVTISLYIPLVVGSMLGLSAMRREDLRIQPDRVAAEEFALFTRREQGAGPVRSAGISAHRA